MNIRDSVKQRAYTQLLTQGDNWESKRGNGFWETRESIAQSTQLRGFFFFFAIKSSKPFLRHKVDPIICRAQSKLKMWSLLFINDEEFQDDERRVLTQVQDPSKCGALCHCRGHSPQSQGCWSIGAKGHLVANGVSVGKPASQGWLSSTWGAQSAPQYWKHSVEDNPSHAQQRVMGRS